MSGRIKHMQRSHYSYRRNNEANVFADFDRKATIKSSNRAMKKSSFLSHVMGGVKKIFHREQSK